MIGPASRWWTLLAFVVLTVVTTSLAAAQGTTASLSGIISDDHGALPGATIVAKDTQSGFTYEAVSDAQGAFNLSGLRPGTYEITVSMRAVQAADRRRCRCCSVRPLTSQFQDRSGRDVCRVGRGRRIVATDRDADVRGFHQRHDRSRCGIFRRTSATSSTSPRSRPARACPTTRRASR